VEDPSSAAGFQRFPSTPKVSKIRLIAGAAAFVVFTESEESSEELELPPQAAQNASKEMANKNKYFIRLNLSD
jgi:hypothetical protein